MKDREERFHEEWLGLAKPYEGLVFSIPVLADAQIAPNLDATLTSRFERQLTPGPSEQKARRIADLERFFAQFLGYSVPGMIVPATALAEDVSFYAKEGGQDIRPSFALARGPFAVDDPLSTFEKLAAGPATPLQVSAPEAVPNSRYFALVWDLDRSTSETLDLDKPENQTGSWRYPPTAKFERLLRHVRIPLGFLSNGEELRLLYAPAGEASAHLTFRVRDLAERAGRPLLTALDLLVHARRNHGSAQGFTLEGLLAESRRRQADVTKDLAEQVFEAVEMLLLGFEQAAARDASSGRVNWLSAAVEEGTGYVHQGLLCVVLRLVFLLYCEDTGILPVGNALYAEHLSILGLYERLTEDAAAHPESMPARFGAYGQLIALFRAVFLGVEHGSLKLPPRQGKLFNPNSYPFLEGGLPEWSAAVHLEADRAEVQVPSVDDGTLHHVLERLIVFKGQRLSYATLGVEQLGHVYESLMGYHVLRVASPAARIGDYRVWVEADQVLGMNPSDRKRFWKETCGLKSGAAESLENLLKTAGKAPSAIAEAMHSVSPGKKGDRAGHRADPGRLVLQPDEERRTTGSHYTPPSLTHRVVETTLLPLLTCLGPERTAAQIFQLKVCDPAMGSGAFLVAACRKLAEEVVDAWTRHDQVAAIAEKYGDPHLHARRLVAQRCLYGVDKNPAAVELGKLSLWLVTLSKDLPFTFLDHALRHGDSLVGLDLDQIKAFHWKSVAQLDYCERALTDALEQATAQRSEILELAEEEDAVSQGEKRRLLEFSRQAIDQIRLVADVCVGAFFACEKDAAREAERKRRLDLVRDFLGGRGEVRAELEELAEEVRKRLTPFHWMIEFPEVFFEERPDPLDNGRVNGAAFMEAVVGNPPFGGKNVITEASGSGYLEWLQAVHPGAHGNSDLSAHFFRRSAMLLGRHGTFGLIATNTISQGDTRATGLKALVAGGWLLYDAVNSMPWPGAAKVTVSLVHAAHGAPCEGLERHLDGRKVSDINSRLRSKPERADPSALVANRDTAFVGTYVLGMGFTLTPEERHALVAKNARNAERIFPYLGGEEVNSSPSQSFDRYVISFGQMELAEAEAWPDLLAIVREKVKPERDRNNREVRKKYWWRFGEVAPALYAAIAPLKRCLVNSLHSKHLVTAFQPTSGIFSHALNVFALECNTAFAVLQSRIHEPWARLLSSSLEDRLRYAASDCFETFPFPKADPRSVIEPLEAIGQELYEARAQFMRDTQQGLTKTYNALKDPNAEDARVLHLRDLHEALDRAVLEAYGWSDIAVPPFCPTSDTDRALLESFQDEVIDRLYLLNAERAKDEESRGLGKKKPDLAKPKKLKGAKIAPAVRGLFEK